MECDKDMGLINQKVHVETPKDWNELIRRCRVRPFPFYIIECDQDIFTTWNSFFNKQYKKNCPMKIRDVRKLVAHKSSSRTIASFATYNGSWETYVIVEKGCITETGGGPACAYSGIFPLSKAK